MTQENPSKCPFCDIKSQLYINSHFSVVRDGFPVSPGHLLIIPNNHVDDFVQWMIRNNYCLAAFSDAMMAAIEIMKREALIDGYNFGINKGSAAGQTIVHAHAHMIPRFCGDTKDPVGGVRNVIPGKGNYLKDA